MKRRTFLITGGTGALGQMVLHDIQSKYQNSKIYVLTRQGSKKLKFLESENLEFVNADLLEENFSCDRFLLKFENVTDVVHMAADVNWARELNTSIKINSYGTKKIVELAIKLSHLKKFIHVSTAYVNKPAVCTNCLSKGNLLREDKEFFNNSYEYSKWKSEEYVISSNLPWTIVRPSMIVGNHKSGKISSFNGVYHILKAICQGLVPFVVGEGKAFADIVPVDIVSDAILSSLSYQSNAYVNQIILAAGFENSPTVDSLIDICKEEVNQYRTDNQSTCLDFPSVVNCDTYSRLLKPILLSELRSSQRRLMAMLEAYHPYFSIGSSFNSQSSENSLAFISPSYNLYLPKCIRYWCTENKISKYENVSRFSLKL
jgi:nucleoside-diphosphate-sugar epimerase